jgi:uncharacterized protein YjcR
MQARLDPSGAWPARNPHAAPRMAIDWHAVERDYRAGALSLRDMANKHGCSHSAIANRASRHQWTRGQAYSARTRLLSIDLYGNIHQLTAPARSGQPFTENIE